MESVVQNLNKLSDSRMGLTETLRVRDHLKSRICSARIKVIGLVLYHLAKSFSSNEPGR